MIGAPTMMPGLHLGADPDKARAIHDRRALDDAAEHAVALGDALDIPAVDLSAVLGQGAPNAQADDHVCTAEEAAAIDWEPWTGECEVPPNEDWPQIGARHLPLARMAWLVNTKTKEGLMQVLADLDEDDGAIVQRLCEDVRDTAEFFRAFHALMETAELRLLTALSTMTVDPRYRHRFDEERAA
jgi:hypothetical protein